VRWKRALSRFLALCYSEPTRPPGLFSMLPFFRRLGFRLPAIFIAFSLLVALANALTLYVSWQLQGSAAAINDLGSERMRSYRIALLLTQSGGKESTDVNPDDQIKKEITRFEEVLNRLEVGDQGRPLFVPPQPAIRRQLSDIQITWSREIRPYIESLLTVPIERRLDYLPRLRNMLDGFVGRIDALVADIEQASSHNTALLGSLQLGLLGLAIGGTVALVYLIILLVVRPVLSLQEGVQRMEQEDFSARVPVESEDEFGDLARGFNRMAAHLQDLYATLEQRVEEKTRHLEARNRELALLYGVSSSLEEPGNIETLCRGFVQAVLPAIGADAASIRMIDPQTQQIHLFVHEGLQPGFITKERCLAQGECLCGASAWTGQTLAQTFPAKDKFPYACEAAGYRSVWILPIAVQKQRLGLFNLYFREARELMPQEQRLLETLVQHLGIAIENRQLVSRERELAVSEERNLLAQELHDSIAQSLAFLNLQAQMLRRSIESGEQEQALAELAQIREGIQESYDDVRELLVHFRLRPGASEFEETVRSALEKFEGQTGIHTHLQISGVGMPLTTEQQLQVLHIVQEALSNVRKHASATKVTVEIQRGETYRIEVRDDGCGIDPRRLEDGGGHVGLKIMRERAHRIGATMDILSTPHKGTSVRLLLPLLQREAA